MKNRTKLFDIERSLQKPSLLCRNKTQGSAIEVDRRRSCAVVDRRNNQAIFEYGKNGRLQTVTHHGHRYHDNGQKKKQDGVSVKEDIATVTYGYDRFQNLCTISRGDGFSYRIDYTPSHAVRSLSVQGREVPLLQYHYRKNGLLREICFANGDSVRVTYNRCGQLKRERWYHGQGRLSAEYRYTYDADGNLIRCVDRLACRETRFTYENGVLTATLAYTLSSVHFFPKRRFVSLVRYTYGEAGELCKRTVYFADGTSLVMRYEATEHGTTDLVFIGDMALSLHKERNRPRRKIYDEIHHAETPIFRRSLFYLPKEACQSTGGDLTVACPNGSLVDCITFSDRSSISYRYDKNGRIKETYDSEDDTKTYVYNAMGELLTETHYGDYSGGASYDNYGNITDKNCVKYQYDPIWRDLLLQYGKEPILHDAQGNPISYLGHTLTWGKGRQLFSFDNTQYTYDFRGNRLSKTVNGVCHTYIWEENRLLREDFDGNTMLPLSDRSGRVFGIVWNGTPFFFKKNIQGDVVAVIDQSGNSVARYDYDPWGVCRMVKGTSGLAIAEHNPYRYRGYYYDAESGFYRIGKRYYDPKLGRFLNADLAESVCVNNHVLKTNAFAYCRNDVVNKKISYVE